MDRELMRSRQSDLIPNRRYKVAIIGCGGIGSNAAHIIASMGVCSHMTLIDYDIVGLENVWPGFLGGSRFLGTAKAQAVAELVAEIDPDMVVETIQSPLEQARLTDYQDIIVVSTDSMATRLSAWERFRNRTRWWIDGRMGGYAAQLYTLDVMGSEHVTEYADGLRTPPTNTLACGQKATAPLTKGFLTLAIGQSVSHIANDKQPPWLQRYDLNNAFWLKLE
jgi:molybdopterin/thiamine biosynthesis adenylyltransferase